MAARFCTQFGDVRGAARNFACSIMMLVGVEDYRKMTFIVNVNVNVSVVYLGINPINTTCVTLHLM